MENYVLNEFLDKRQSKLLSEFDSFLKVQEFMKTHYSALYPCVYRNEPPVPFVWVRLEEIEANQRISHKSFCYYGKYKY